MMSSTREALPDNNPACKPSICRYPTILAYLSAGGNPIDIVEQHGNIAICRVAGDGERGSEGRAVVIMDGGKVDGILQVDKGHGRSTAYLTAVFDPENPNGVIVTFFNEAVRNPLYVNMSQVLGTGRHHDIAK